MKYNFLKLSILLLSFSLVVACNNSSNNKVSKGTTTDGKEAFVEVEIFDVHKIKDQIVEIIKYSPNVDEITNLLNRAGASYIIDLTVPISKAEEAITSTKQNLLLGMYSFDIHYAKVYNRMDEAIKIIEVENQVINKLGLSKELISSEKYIVRIKENSDNKDSVDYYVTQNMNFIGNKLATGDYPDVYALSFIGSNIEALYIISQLTILANDNSEMLKILSSQNKRVNSVFMIMELMSGSESVAPYYDAMKPLAKFFEEHATIDEEGLKVVTPMIEKVRESML
jgi:hypothetical protein